MGISQRKPRVSLSGKFIYLQALFLIFICLVVSVAHAEKGLLFKSNFGAGISINAPHNFYATGNGAWQEITGLDSETGYSWPVKAFGARFSGVQLITIDPVTSETIGNYIVNEIRKVVGPNGESVNALYQNVKIKGAVGQAGSQAPFVFVRPYTAGDVKDLYLTYWIKYPADLADKLDATVSSGNWRTQFEFKTGGYDGNDGSGDYRIITNIYKHTDGKLYWMTKGDSQANGPIPRITYWLEDNRVVPVPVGEWFKFEVFWHRSRGKEGRFCAAVNEREIVKYQGSTMGEYNLPVTRIMVNNAYSGGHGPVESYTTGLEIWEVIPAARMGKFCYF
ncbi:hypothetical protein [Nitrosomonas sp. wSCUT-2]